MPDWLEPTIPNTILTTPILLAYRIGLALLMGLAVSGLYRWARRGRTIEPTFVNTLILLAVAIAMAIQVIGDSVARAFSLVGALSVVRFRTVVKDTQDTAFVILAVVMGMAAGASHLMVAIIGLGIVTVATPFLWPRRASDPWRVSEGLLSVRLSPAESVRTAADELLAASTLRADQVSAKTARGGALLVLTYRFRPRPGITPAALVVSLKTLEGVKSVSLRRAPG